MAEERKLSSIRPEDAIVKRLSGLNLIPPHDIELVRKLITDGFQDYQCCGFCFEDVIGCFDRMKYAGEFKNTQELTEENCLGVIATLWDRFDANDGCTWSSVQEAIRENIPG